MKLESTVSMHDAKIKFLSYIFWHKFMRKQNTISEML